MYHLEWSQATLGRRKLQQQTLGSHSGHTELRGLLTPWYYLLLRQLKS
jgi:hypothetical protein